MIKIGNEYIFNTTYTDLLHFNGLKVKVIEIITESNDDFDPEVLPMYRVNLKYKGQNLATFEDELYNTIDI